MVFTVLRLPVACEVCLSSTKNFVDISIVIIGTLIQSWRIMLLRTWFSQKFFYCRPIFGAPRFSLVGGIHGLASSIGAKEEGWNCGSLLRQQRGGGSEIWVEYRKQDTTSAS